MADRSICEATFVDSGGGSVTLTNYGVINIVAGGNVTSLSGDQTVDLHGNHLAAKSDDQFTVSEDAPRTDFDGCCNLNSPAAEIPAAKNCDKTDSKSQAQNARRKFNLGDVKEKLRSTSEESNQHSFSKIEELCNIVNENTKRTTAVCIIEDYDSETLNEPAFQVYPQMRRVQKYFKGGYEKFDDLEVEVTKGRFFRKTKKRVVKNQTRREMGFHYDTKQRDELVMVDEFVKSLTTKGQQTPDRKTPVTAVVASAGSGKTTLLRRIARRCVESCTKSSQELTTTKRQKHIKLVHYLEMKNMKYEENTTPSKFLFKGLCHDEADEDRLYRWLLDHQSEAILYFDGLDQATWNINESSARKINSFEKSSSAEIMYNLLSRNVLPRVKIVIASREFKVSELPAKSRPNDIINLVGLKREDAERCFISLIGKQGEAIWENIKKLSPRLLNIVSVPVFLVLTAAVMARDPERPPPATITDLYNRLLLSLRRVEIIQERERIMSIIHKLKAMAHQGMMEGRVVFHKSDLERFDLSIEDARDLMIKVPGNNILTRHLLEGDFVFFFCHQSLQEFLSGSFVAEMSAGKFRRFNDTHLQEGRWSVVRTFVSGILHDMSVTDLHQVSNAKYKQKVFRRAIQSQVKKDDNGVELLAPIYESNSDDLIRSLPNLPSVRGTRLGLGETHMFASILARRGDAKIRILDLEGCGINDSHIDIIVQNTNGKKIQVKELFLRKNPFSMAKMNSLLVCLDADRIEIGYFALKNFKHDELNWDNIRKVTFFGVNDLSISNKDGCLTIEGNIKGHFKTSSAEQRVFLFNEKDCNGEIFMDLASFFSPHAIRVSFENQIPMKPADFVKMKTTPSIDGKIAKILLDCRSCEAVDTSLIDMCVRKYQVTFLEIIVNEKTSFIPRNFLHEIERHIDHRVKAVWWFKVHGTDDVDNLVHLMQQNQVENLRLPIDRSSSMDDVTAVIEQCKLKRLTLVYESKFTPLRRKHGAIVKLAKSHFIEVESVILYEEKGAWGVVDSRQFLK